MSSQPYRKLRHPRPSSRPLKKLWCGPRARIYSPRQFVERDSYSSVDVVVIGLQEGDQIGNAIVRPERRSILPSQTTPCRRNNTSIISFWNTSSILYRNERENRMTIWVEKNFRIQAFVEARDRWMKNLHWRYIYRAKGMAKRRKPSAQGWLRRRKEKRRKSNSLV